MNYITITLQLSMDPKCRALPHLNAYFLQRKAYESHRKKIELIRSSMTRAKSIKNEQQAKDIVEHATQVKTPIKYSLKTIKQQIKSQLNPRISPWAKRRREQTQKQNNRLFGRIQKCQSTISRKQIENHRIKNEEMKERLSKFIYSPYSHKTLLKCKHSLEILRQKEKKRDEMSQNFTRNPSRMRYSRSEVSHMQRHGSSQLLNYQPSLIEKKASLDRLYLLRNKTKIRSHFDKKSQLSFSTNKNRDSSQLEPRNRVKTQIRHSKNKCFTTQIDG